MNLEGIEATEATMDQLRVELDQVAPGRPTVVAEGKFDGVHWGHRALLEAARRRADALGAVPGALTFDPLPWVAFHPGTPYHYLMPLDERVARLRELGAEFVAVLTFTPEFSRLTARQFVAALR